MLFPALPWEPCLYYNKAQPRSFLGQTSAAGHLLIVSSPEHRRGRDGEEGSAFQRQRSPACNLVCLSRERWERGRPCLGARRAPNSCASRAASRAARGRVRRAGVGTVRAFVPRLGAPLEAEELMSSSSSFGRL